MSVAATPVGAVGAALVAGVSVVNSSSDSVRVVSVPSLAETRTSYWVPGVKDVRAMEVSEVDPASVHSVAPVTRTSTW